MFVSTHDVRSSTRLEPASANVRSSTRLEPSVLVRYEGNDVAKSFVCEERGVSVDAYLRCTGDLGDDEVEFDEGGDEDEGGNDKQTLP